MTGLPFTITLDSQGFYRVSIPNYEGGEVVTVEDANAAVAAAVQAERERGDQRVLDECEACAQTIEMFDNDGEWIGKLEYAAAIRARHGLSTRIRRIS